MHTDLPLAFEFRRFLHLLHLRGDVLDDRNVVKRDPLGRRGLLVEVLMHHLFRVGPPGAREGPFFSPPLFRTKPQKPTFLFFPAPPPPVSNGKRRPASPCGSIRKRWCINTSTSS